MPARTELEEIDFRTLSSEGREALMVQAAKGYYELDRTMADIAKSLGLTRFQVARLLKDAREQGVVRIEIVPRAQRRPDLEAALQRTYGLREAIVVPNLRDDDGLIDMAAQAAGQFLAGLVPRPALVGVSWGRTMASVAYWLPHRWNDGVEVVLLNGAMNIHATELRTNNIAELFASAGNGRAILLPVPAMVGRAETRIVLEQDPVIADALSLGQKATVVCFGLGGMTPDSVLVRSGSLAETDIVRLSKRGAVGDLLGRFVDSAGRIVDTSLDARTIGLDPLALRDKEIAMGVAVGHRKHQIVLAALRAKLVNVLVTDEQTARVAMEAAHAGK
ncbi:sugar-binding transcriptional regulator [Acetobacteraceae bacterium KSS8]|uniref:Sugar-binding transcriptional regulator n=1 Tax=Endosaccharibacter trunci TaxID=2812733 RepID=A0ABT1W7D9_9PROT|nr:sugar-binding transcriptional regulator [Acetobacteraceae bacterium KSS8]